MFSKRYSIWYFFYLCVWNLISLTCTWSRRWDWWRQSLTQRCPQHLKKTRCTYKISTDTILLTSSTQTTHHSRTFISIIYTPCVPNSIYKREDGSTQAVLTPHYHTFIYIIYTSSTNMHCQQHLQKRSWIYTSSTDTTFPHVHLYHLDKQY